MRQPFSWHYIQRFSFFAPHSKIDYTSNSQYKRFLTQGQNFKITNSSTMKNVVAVVAVFFRGEKWRNGAVYRTQKVRQASSGVCRTLSQKKAYAILYKNKSLVANFHWLYKS